ncbi:MAG: phosphodiester glycosidase family protein [Oscillospiraceae bacterium]|nr:phosphodiester glycosidase family protein [Oscillospiraceae bacterium]
MKFKRILAGICTIALLFTHAFAALSQESWTWGTIVSSASSVVAPGAQYTQVSFTTPKGPQVAHMIEFHTNNQGLKLRAGLSNGYIYGTQTVLGMADALDKQYPGQVIAAVNADFFNFGEGVPFGIMIDGGELLTTPPNYYRALVIKSDGTAKILDHGSMMNRILDLRGSLQQLTGVNIPHSEANSLVLYNHRYAASTKSSADSVEVVCKVLSGEFRDEETLSLRVSEVRTVSGNTPLSEGNVVLSGVGSYKDLLASLQVGEEFTVRFAFVEAWKDTEFAVAGNQILLKDGVVQNISDGANAPRTVVGLKADGSMVLLTLDGRQSSYSAGGTYKNVATVLRDLGCVDAMNLDGGGSTTFVLRPIGEFGRRVVNRPSDGSARRVANAIVLCNTTPQNGAATSLLVKTAKRTLLVGETYPGFSDKVFAVDANLHPKTVGPILFALDPSYGTVSANGDISPTAPGEVSLAVSAAGLNTSVALSFVDTVTKIESSSSTLTIKASESKTIPVALYHNTASVEFSRKQLHWAVEGKIGSITPTGEFTADKMGGEGAIVISHGSTSLRIPVKVDGPTSKFQDLEHHLWALDAINRLADAGVISGTSATTFAPAKSITRADFMLLLTRMMQLDPALGAGEQFTDVDGSAYYANALAAAKTLGIAQGSATGEFFPTRSITREEMFTLIYRVMQKMGALSEDASADALSAFSDSAQISEYAKTPIATLTQKGLIAGSNGNVNPKASTTRAEAAVMIDRVRTATGGNPL